MTYKNKEEARRRKREWYAANTERAKRYNRKYNATHREERNEYSKKWKAANREKLNRRRRKKRAANPMKARENNRRYQSNNRRKVNESNKKWRSANLGKAKNQAKKRKNEIRETVLTHYSNGFLRCANCGYDVFEALALDHTNNNGAEHRRELNQNGKQNIYYWAKRNNFPDGFQVLCSNCNWLKWASPDKFLEIGNEHKEQLKENPTTAGKENKHKKNILVQLALF